LKHIIVIGAGIVGAATADRLAASGARVTLIDAGPPGGGTSATSLGWLNANKTVDPGYFGFRIAAMRMWAQLATEFGAPLWYVPHGNLTWAVGEARAELAARVDRLRDRDYRARLLTVPELADIEPAVRIPPAAVAAHFPDEGFVHGGQAAQALAARAQAAGARVIAHDRVTRLDHGDGHVTGVRLASGDRLAADTVVCAAGWRTPEILATAQLSIALLDATAPSSPAPCLVTTTTGPTPLHGIVHAPDVYARPGWDGGLLLEASDIDAATDMTSPSAWMHTHAAELLDRACRIVAGLGVARIAGVHRCVRPLPTDGLPLVGWCHPGLYVAVTHSGITLGPHLARLITTELLNETPTDDLTAYRPGRTAVHG
jgi:glycine/D-amino acid oxidase-like deaminating enzyme